ncbi:MAG: alpha/beta fold hydrolase [Rhodothalassiaceae bacterium]
MSDPRDDLEAWRRAGAVYRHRGHEIFYRTGGAGPALLLLHGFPTACWDFSPLWAALTARFTVVAPDFIGFGFSAKPKPYPYSFFDQADLVEGLLQSLGIAGAHLLAHDYGDTVAQELLARRCAGRARIEIASAVLMNGGMFYSRIRFSPMQRLLRSPAGAMVQHLMHRRRFHASFAAIFGPRTRPSAQMLDAFWRLVTCNHGRRVIHRVIQYLGERQRFETRWTRALAEAGVPLRLIYGPEDPISGSAIAERFAEVVPDADIVRLDGIGHYPQLEAPADVADAVFAFHRRIGSLP